MGLIFPLSGIGRFVLVLIAVAVGMIWWALAYPESFKRIIASKFKKEKENKKKEA